MAECSGNSDDHCCYLGGEVCEFLEEGTVPGRRWACGLRRECGSWVDVHSDPRYVREIRPRLDSLGIVDCGRWPPPGKTCAQCGAKD